jgi:hypothetical protein
MSDNPYIPEITNGVRVYHDGRLVFQYDNDTKQALTPVDWWSKISVQQYVLNAFKRLTGRDF